MAFLLCLCKCVLLIVLLFCLTALISTSAAESKDDGCDDCPRCNGSELCKCNTLGNKYYVFCDGLQERSTLKYENFPRERCVDELHVDNFKFKSLSSKTFPTGLCVKQLHFKRDVILDVAKDTFANLLNITEIIFSDVQIISDSKNGTNLTGILTALTTINTTFTLELNGMRLTSMNKSLLSKLNVKHLRFNRNEFALFDISLVSILTGLKSLSITHNKIAAFVQGNVTSQLRTLELYSNRLKAETIHFCKPGTNESSFPKLEILKLGKNSINNITSKTFMCLQSLKELDLYRNKIQTFDLNVLQESFPILEKLSLRKNWLKISSPDPFIFTRSLPLTLNYIDLSENDFIIYIPFLCNTSSLPFYNNITHLDLRYNHISAPSPEPAICLQSVEELYLGRNALNELNTLNFSCFPNLKGLYLESQINGISKISETALNHLKLQKLDLSDNFIKFEKNMGKLFSANLTLKVLNVSGNFVSNIKAFSNIVSPLQTLNMLVMRRTGLTKFPYQIVTTLRNLKILILTSNQIRSLAYHDTVTFEASNMTFIDLSWNTIKFSKETYFPDEFTNTFNISALNIANNIFGCSCSDGDVNFRSMITSDGSIKNTKLKYWPNAYKCVDSNAILIDYYKTKTDCDVDKRPILYIVVPAVAFVTIVLSSVVFWNRWFVQYYYYKFKQKIRSRRGNGTEEEERLVGEGIFARDAFVIYSSDSLSFVKDEFRSLLETTLKYRLCIWDRESKIGLWIQDAYFEEMDSSKHFIVIVDTKLMKDEWCQFQVDVAIHLSIRSKKKHADEQRRIFLVLRDDVDFSLTNVKKSWCVILTKTPSGKWCGQRNNMRHDVFIEDLKDTIGEPQRRSYVDT